MEQQQVGLRFSIPMGMIDSVKIGAKEDTGEPWARVNVAYFGGNANCTCDPERVSEFRKYEGQAVNVSGILRHSENKWGSRIEFQITTVQALATK